MHPPGQTAGTHFQWIAPKPAARNCRVARLRQKTAAKTGVLQSSYRPVALHYEGPPAKHSLGPPRAIVNAAMDPMTAIAASGLRSRMESLDLLANNVANASTGGYKADREFYSLYVCARSAGCGLGCHHAGDRAALDRSVAGRDPATGNSLDVALSRQGFLCGSGARRDALHPQRQLSSGRRRPAGHLRRVSGARRRRRGSAPLKRRGRSRSRATARCARTAR